MSLQFQDSQFDEELPRYKSGLDTRPSRDLSIRALLSVALRFLRRIYAK